MIVNSIRNDQGHFINTEYFREAARHFQKYGRYCDYPVGTYEWHEFAKQETRRLVFGMEVAGARITGPHYYYLNYSPIKRTKEFQKQNQIQIGNKRRSRAQTKVRDFPDFWDGDYNYYHALNIARNGVTKRTFLDLHLGWTVPRFSKMSFEDVIGGASHLCVGKARRKGFSFKNGSIATHAYHTIPESLSVIGAYESKFLYPEGTMGMANYYLDFQNDHAPHLFKRRLTDRVSHKESGYTEVVNGQKLKRGFRSQIMALTFKNNVDAARGKDAYFFMMEEAGKWPNLEDALNTIIPTTTDGIYMVGQIVVFGTGGDMEAGTVDFAKLFYNPEPYNFMALTNIWDEDATDTSCSYFFPNRQNNPGFIDEHGNSDLEAAYAEELRIRQHILSTSKGTYAYNKRVQEYAESPSEAFLMVSANGLPVKEFRKRLHQLLYDESCKNNYDVLKISESQGDDKTLHVRIDVSGELNPIIQYPLQSNDTTGAIVCYEKPIKDAPPDTYFIGMDPYNQDQSDGPSIGSILVYKSIRSFGVNMRQIVAEYNGRPETADDFHHIGYLLSRYYNDATIMHENMYRDTRMYYKNKGEYWRLAPQPDLLIAQLIGKSTVKRPKGIHMTTEIKDAGLKAIVKWAMSIIDYDETTGEPIRVWQRINSIGLLQELCSFDMKGNYDRVMALMMCLFMEDQLKLETAHEEVKKQDNRIEQLKRIREKRLGLQSTNTLANDYGSQR